VVAKNREKFTELAQFFPIFNNFSTRFKGASLQEIRFKNEQL